MPGFRKRTYGSSFPSVRKYPARKKTRYSRKKFSSRRKTSSFGSSKGNVVQFNYKAKKISPRAWRHKLWDSTLQKTHYRSSSVVASNFLTTGTALNQQWGRSPALGSVALANVFYLIPTQVDPSVSPPLFKDNVIVRGGCLWIDFYNDTSSSLGPLNVKVYLIKTNKRPDFTAIDVTIATPPTLAFDMLQVPDFRGDVGKKVIYREFMLESNGAMKVEFRLPVFVVDQGEYGDSTNPNPYYMWLFSVADFDPVDVNTVRVRQGYNVSFSADAIGTT